MDGILHWDGVLRYAFFMAVGVVCIKHRDLNRFPIIDMDQFEKDAPTDTASSAIRGLLASGSLYRDGGVYRAFVVF